MRRRLALILALSSATVTAGPNVLSSTAHAAEDIGPAIVAVLGAGHVDVDIFVDETSTDNGTNFLGTGMIAAAVNATRVNFQVANPSNQVNHAPYAIVTQSSLGFSVSNLDLMFYSSLQSNGVLYSWPMVYPDGTPTPPPVISTNIEAGAINPNRGGAIEFSMSANYKGLDTSTSSAVTAGFAGLLAAFMHNHTGWTMQDAKAAFRQTGPNWSTGWSTNLGYGNIDWDSANLISSTGSLYLQPPIITAVSAGMNKLTITDYPYRQTRRDHEVVGLFPSGYPWPVKNEYTTADLTTAVAAGGMLIYTSNSTDMIPTATVSFSVAPGAYDLIGFTTDSAGHFSRVELFSRIPVVGSCL